MEDLNGQWESDTTEDYFIQFTKAERTKLRGKDSLRRKKKGIFHISLENRILKIIPTVFQINNHN